MALTQTITARRMAAAGVPFHDAHWYFSVARPRNFRGEGDVERANRILLQTVHVKH